MTIINIPTNEQFDSPLQFEIKKESSRIAFITGAGASAGSGLPTYYGENGLYTNLKENPEDILNDYNMENNPSKIWDAIGELVIKGLSLKPTETHNKIAEIESHALESLVFTQNVDMFHKKAGSKNVIQIHGAAENCKCNDCRFLGRSGILKTEDIIHSLKNNKTPICPFCRTVNVVPDIIAFGQMIDEDKIHLKDQYFSKPVELCFVVGTQLHFQYIQDALHDVKSYNEKAIIIDVNPDPNYDNPLADYIFRENADDFFKRIALK